MSFGTVGLFAVSVIDSSIIPLPVPGSTDLLLILLVAHRANPFLAAIAATVGSILGGYLTWGTGSKGGEAALHRHMPKRFARRLTRWVESKGTLAVTISALLPPPFPLMPLLLAAGALGVSRRRFLVSFSLARTFRYALVAWLAATYGRAMVRAFRHYLAGWSTPLMWTYLGLVVAGILYGVWKFRRDRHQTSAPRAATVSAN
jgi:membrane protein YqaA with SNARE-associated domain